MTRAEAALIEWARAEKAVDDAHTAWAREVNVAETLDDVLKESRAWTAVRAAESFSETAFHRVREVAQELLDAQQPAGYATARLKPGEEY